MSDTVAYQQLGPEYAVAVKEVEMAAAQALINPKTIVAKTVDQYQSMLSDSGYTFWGAFYAGELIGTAGIRHVQPHEAESLRELIGPQRVSIKHHSFRASASETSKWRISTQPISLPRPHSDSALPISMMFSLRVHPRRNQAGVGTNLNIRRLEGALDDLGVSHVMVDMEAGNGAALAVQKKSASQVGTALLITGAAHDIDGDNPTPCVTLVHSRSITTASMNVVHSLPMKDVLGRNAKDIDGEYVDRFHGLSHALHCGWAAVVSGDQLHIIERPSCFSSPRHQISPTQIVGMLSSKRHG